MLKSTKSLLIKTAIYFAPISFLIMHALFLSQYSQEKFGWVLILGMFGGFHVLALIYILLSIWYFHALFFYFFDKKTELMEKDYSPDNEE